jgi:MFS transporter, FSR family, fosmidomycin resistance protein
MALLSAGHGVDDISAGAIPALLPFLVTQRHLSYAAAAGLVLAFTMASSIGQPAFGHLADRSPRPWLMPAGVVISGLGVALTGVASSYRLTFLACVLSGIGVAAYHPEAARFANYVSGARRATGMSIFSVGGGVGFALGPAAITPLVLAFGLPGTLFMLLPALIMAILLFAELPHLERFRPPATRRDEPAPHRVGGWSPFSRLVAVAILRQVVYYALLAFGPLYFVRVFLASPAHANLVLTAMLAAGAVGTIVTGPLADRYGRRTALIGALGLCAILTAAFTISNELFAAIALIAAGAAIVGTFSTALVMGQEFLPRNLGLASGLTLGLPDGVGGLTAPLLGLVADHAGLRVVLQLSAIVAVLAVVVAFTLPKAASRS